MDSLLTEAIRQAGKDALVANWLKALRERGGDGPPPEKPPRPRRRQPVGISEFFAT
jgi:hypothetical protein